MAALSLLDLARALVDIDSTTGREAEACAWLAGHLRERGFHVTEQPVSGGRTNVVALVDPRPTVVLSTHIDCVPPFFPSSVEHGLLYGRGACDAKGALAAQVTAAERLRESGEERVGLLFVVGEERGSDGAVAANAISPGPAFLVNGEPTESKLGLATRGAFRVKLKATGRAAHSSQPERGISAIDLLIDALVELRGIALPEEPDLGRTFYATGLISGGVAPNVISPSAEAELNFRTVGPGSEVLERLAPLRSRVALETVLEVPPVRMRTVPGFDTAAFAFTTDIPLLDRWGEPLLFGPGSVLDAHTDGDHVAIAELEAAASAYEAIARALLREAADGIPTR
jgi:acetylornithine deacetylase